MTRWTYEEVRDLYARAERAEAERDALQQMIATIRDAFAEMAKCPKCETCREAATGMLETLRGVNAEGAGTTEES